MEKQSTVKQQLNKLGRNILDDEGVRVGIEVFGDDEAGESLGLGSTTGERAEEI